MSCPCVPRTTASELRVVDTTPHVRDWQLDHPNVVKLKAFYEDAHKFYLVMELLTGGELLDSLIEKVTYSEAEARTLVETLARAIDYCHGKGVVHRDLKVRRVGWRGRGAHGGGGSHMCVVMRGHHRPPPVDDRSWRTCCCPLRARERWLRSRTSASPSVFRRSRT